MITFKTIRNNNFTLSITKKIQELLRNNYMITLITIMNYNGY